MSGQRASDLPQIILHVPGRLYYNLKTMVERIARISRPVDMKLRIGSVVATKSVPRERALIMISLCDSIVIGWPTMRMPGRLLKIDQSFYLVYLVGYKSLYLEYRCSRTIEQNKQYDHKTQQSSEKFPDHEASDHHARLVIRSSRFSKTTRCLLHFSHFNITAAAR